MREWLKESRLRRGLTMKEISEKLGITEGYYSLIESGDRQKKMDVTLVAKLSIALDIPTRQIVELENSEI